MSVCSQCRPWLTVSIICLLPSSPVSSPCKVSHSEGQGKASWVVVSFLFFFFLHGSLWLSPLLSGVYAHSQVRTGTQINLFFFFCLPCDPPSVLFRLGMNADPDKPTGRKSEHEPSYIGSCLEWVGGGVWPLTPLPVAVGKAAWKKNTFQSHVNLDKPGNGSLEFHPACILGGSPRAN